MNQPRPLLPPKIHRGLVDEHYHHLSVDARDRHTELPLLNDDDESKTTTVTNLNECDEEISVAMSQADEYRHLTRHHSMSSTDTLRDKYEIPAEQFVFIGIWIGLLLCNFFWTRFWCSVGIPSDCHSHFRVTNFEDIKELFTLGLIMGFLTGMHLPERFFYIFDFKRTYWRGITFITLFFVASPAFGSISLLPWMTHFNITPDKLKNQNFANILVIFTVICLVVGLVGFHVRQAHRRCSKTGFTIYMLSRGLVWAFYIAYGSICMRQALERGLKFHLHHYFLAFLISILAEFNHPFSLVVLAISSAIFAQGLAAYEAAPLFSSLN